MLAFNQDIGDDMIDDGMDKGYGSFSSGISIPPAGSSHNQWKILVYDKVCRSIISPLVSVSQLRRRGVTLHLLINSEREPIPDVPVVYFVAPTKENLAIIAKDCANKLYGRAYINLVTKLDRSLMEEFASLVVQSGSLNSIASIHDQYLDYVCLERRLFTLNKPNSYAIYNKTDATQESIESYMTSIAHGLFSVVATMGSIPIIRCPKNGAPEMVARKLYKMIVDHPTLLRNKKSSMASGNYRPLLVLLDRNADLITPCQHTSTYQALIDDVLDHRVNRVDFDVNTDTGNEEKKAKKNSKQHKRFDLDPDTDTFYCQHKFQPFPEAIESNSVELQEVTEREQEIRSKATSNTSSNEIGDDPLFNPSANGTDSLANAVDSLPALLDRKKQLEMHTSILQAVMNEVAARDIPPFFEQESSLATGKYKNDQEQAKTDILQIISDPEKGTIQDNVRLILVYCLATKATTADLDEVIQSLEKAIEIDDEKKGGKRSNPNVKKNEDGVKAIRYIRQLRSMNMLSIQANSTETISDSVGSATAGLSSFMAKTATGLLAKATDRVSSILGKTHKHYATRVIEHLCEMKNNTEDDEYLYLDPRVKGDIDIAKLKLSSGSTSGAVAGSIRRAPIKDVVCFVIGGGSYGEYQNLQMLAKSDDEQGSSVSNTSVSVGGNLRGSMTSSSSANSKARSITYGSTEIMDAESFVSQLGQLG